MTKNLFISAFIVLLSMTLCPLFAQNISKNVNVKNFSAINLQSVGNIVFTQSSNYSCKIEGSSEYVEKTLIEIDNNTLIIKYKQNNSTNVKNLIFYITAPDLEYVKIDGVGDFTAKETLKLKNLILQLNGVGNYSVKDLRCDEVTANVNGVGNMDLNVNCRNVNAKVAGVGNITLLGKTDSASLKRDGVGRINHKGLKCENAASKTSGF